jgi:hypothetical protein
VSHDLAALEGELAALLEKTSRMEFIKDTNVCDALAKKREDIEKSIFT